MTALAPNYLDPRTLAAITPLELRARMIVEGLMTGMHRSPYQGFSVEFAQHRQYTPGDDPRYLDWKVYGRTDKLYLKQYQKETNLDLVVLVDASGSMAYSSPAEQSPGIAMSRLSGGSGGSGGWSKYDHAASLAAAMAYLALRQQDRVGLVLFTNQVVHASRMSNAHDHWRSLVDILSDPNQAKPRDPRNEVRRVPGVSGVPGPGRPGSLEHPGVQGVPGVEIAPDVLIDDLPTDAPSTDLARVFDQLLAKLTQRSLIVLISDLFDSADSLDRAMARVHHRHHDLIVLQTLDHAELTFPFRSPTDFVGLENEGRIGLDPPALRKAYLEAIHAHLRRIEEITRRFHFGYLLLDSSEPLGPPLSHFLARRSAMASKGK